MKSRVARAGRVGIGAGIDQRGGQFIVRIAGGEVERAGAGAGGAVRLSAFAARERDPVVHVRAGFQ